MSGKAWDKTFAELREHCDPQGQNLLAALEELARDYTRLVRDYDALWLRFAALRKEVRS